MLHRVVPAPARDISGMQASPFYGLPPQGQQVAFAPQAHMVLLGGIYHPSHTVTGAAVIHCSSHHIRWLELLK
ncbi:hypothetical protein ACP4OV_007526 [Aristida adscensionis]